MSPIRRIVTGHDASGKSVFLSVGEPPQFHGRPPGPTVFYELWNTAPTPARITAVEEREPNDRLPLRLPPDAGGTIVWPEKMPARMSNNSGLRECSRGSSAVGQMKVARIFSFAKERSKRFSRPANIMSSTEGEEN